MAVVLDQLGRVHGRSMPQLEAAFGPVMDEVLTAATARDALALPDSSGRRP